MQRKTFATAVVAVVAALTIGFGGYFANQKSSGSEVVTVDRTALVRPHSPSMGKAEAPVVIVEFLDPACETCRTFYPMVKKLMAEHPDRIRLVLRYAPFHKGSDKVVAVLEAARRQGKFWPALEALLASQHDWASDHTAKVDLVWKHLDGIGLNMEQLAIDLTAPDVKQVVAQDWSDANTLGVSQTPEYFVNGRPLPSFGFEQLQQLVGDELSRTH
ncbi:MAG: thioredoxin domain-containing protein [Burkholderiales bacterium]|nr:thioredoxin domain-containing protein [Burkholderiales bacterium]